MALRIIGGAIPSIAYASTAAQSATAQVFTFNAQAAGTAKSTRYLLVGVLATAGSSSVQINGVTMTALLAGEAYMLAVPTGDTVTVTVTQTISTFQTVTITVTAIYDIRSSTATASSTSNASPAVLDLNVSARGVIWAQANAGTAATATWTGLNEDLDTSSSLTRSVATVAVINSEAPRTVRCAYTASSAPRAIAFSWR